MEAGMDYATLLENQQTRQAEALEYKEASADLATEYQLASANEKNKEAISASVAATANAQSTALSRA
ncbi:MAG: hypothetical protein KAH03_02935 [Cocleimonas sp.]|nr:hypothetical protein [Cocleimonas sp.]